MTITRSAIAGRVRTLGALILISGGCFGVASSSASAATTVSGSQYAVNFAGTGSNEVAWSNDGSSGEEKGTWTIADPGGGDPAITVWLPARYDSAEEDSGSGLLTDGAMWPGSAAEPASLTETGVDKDADASYSCSSSTVQERGEPYVVDQATVTLGVLTLQTNGWGFANSRSTDWSCNPEGPFFGFTYPPDPGSTDGGQIAYLANVPFSDVGQANITLPVTDESTVNQASYWESSGWDVTSHDFSISGSYTLKKLCDGTITYSGNEVDGSCGSGSGGTGGGGSGPGGGPGPGPGGTNPRPASGPAGGNAKRPDTRITGRTINHRERNVTFKFKALGAATGFQCALVKAPKHKAKRPAKPVYRACRSPKAYKHLAHGSYTFYVRAMASSGPDATSASAKFKL